MCSLINKAVDYVYVIGVANPSRLANPPILTNPTMHLLFSLVVVKWFNHQTSKQFMPY